MGNIQMKKVIGYAMMSLPFLHFFALQAQEYGFVETLISWAVSLLIIGLFLLGAYLSID
jgi:hypothetical protein